MNNYVVTEVLLHLPFESLLRFRAVCKFWCYIIDCKSFRHLHTELHTNNNNDNDKADDAVYLQSLLDKRERLTLYVDRDSIQFKGWGFGASIRAINSGECNGRKPAALAIIQAIVANSELIPGLMSVVMRDY
ncbi:hypothetical protein SASPL_146119 [Salvia splendens]|uniref:F-box domain-containing protein n=1 Tax=Salvia splendens TaxID=180675 RepID=A0A8X8Z8Z9_SALSN|nr:hypothetical protein SASPL_146119 [Salvia splendens]